jgi:hypothetical protein
MYKRWQPRLNFARIVMDVLLPTTTEKMLSTAPLNAPLTVRSGPPGRSGKKRERRCEYRACAAVPTLPLPVLNVIAPRRAGRNRRGIDRPPIEPLSVMSAAPHLSAPVNRQSIAVPHAGRTDIIKGQKFVPIFVIGPSGLNLITGRETTWPFAGPDTKTGTALVLKNMTPYSRGKADLALYARWPSRRIIRIHIWITSTPAGISFAGYCAGHAMRYSATRGTIRPSFPAPPATSPNTEQSSQSPKPHPFHFQNKPLTRICDKTLSWPQEVHTCSGMK